MPGVMFGYYYQTDLFALAERSYRWCGVLGVGAVCGREGVRAKVWLSQGAGRRQTLASQGCWARGKPWGR